MCVRVGGGLFESCPPPWNPECESAPLTFTPQNLFGPISFGIFLNDGMAWGGYPLNYFYVVPFSFSYAVQRGRMV